MHDVQPRPIRTGSDPRTLSDFIALRDEMNKLTHPARPDVNWKQVEALSLALFERNGVELQTAAWYTLARSHLARVNGMNEGLSILCALLSHQWAQLWPQPVHARAEILNGLFQRLQKIFRTFSLNHDDQPALMQAEKLLGALDDVLTRQQLKHACQNTGLQQQVQSALTRLENSASPADVSAAITLPPQALASELSQDTQPPVSRLVYVIRPEPEMNVQVLRETPPSPPKRWPVFIAGASTALVVGALALWGWNRMHPEFEPLPVAANGDALKTLSQQPPLWLVNYGFVLAARAEPQEREKLKSQWQQYITSSALPEQNLAGWHQGMERLTTLTAKLNGLDEKRGKYLTVSELKSMVFTATQAFNQSVPLEEQLRRLALKETPQPASVKQIDLHFQQLLASYALMTTPQE